MTASALELEKLAAGVYFLKHSTPNAPSQHLIDEVMHSRFMDRFYVSEDLDKLDKRKVTSICRARSSIPSAYSKDTPNGKVKEIFRNFIINTKPVTLLEIGAGLNPASPIPNLNQKFILSDFDDFYSGEKINDDYTYVIFSDQNNLSFPNEYFEIMLACFVFQFPVYQSQLNEISRCLTPDGILLCNVYRRNSQARLDLRTQLQEAGLTATIIPDPLLLCRDNEYWLIHKNGNRTLGHHLAEIKRCILSEEAGMSTTQMIP